MPITKDIGYSTAMSAYISAVFEKDRLITAGKIRVITRNRDDGVVPPTPGPTYFPTHPNNMQYFIVGNYNGSTEAYVGVSTLAQLTSITARALDYMEDTTVNFSTAGVLVDDIISVSITDPAYWTSAEYPGTNPFQFVVKTVAPGGNVNRLELYAPFPAFYNGFSWTITRLSLTKYAGKTLRNGAPGAGNFRDRRFNRVYDDVTAAENAVTATKADMLSLTNEVAGANLVSETVTVSSSI